MRRLSILTKLRISTRTVCAGRRLFSATFSPYHAFQVLGLPPNATQPEIKAAYYALAKTFHPDTSSADDLAAKQAKFIQVSDAFKLAYEAAAIRPKSGEMASREYTYVDPVAAAKYRAEWSDADLERLRKEAEAYVRELKMVFDVQWNGQTTSNSGPDWGGHFWYLRMQQQQASEDGTQAWPSETTSGTAGSSNP